MYTLMLIVAFALAAPFSDVVPQNEGLVLSADVAVTQEGTAELLCCGPNEPPPPPGGTQ